MTKRLAKYGRAGKRHDGERWRWVASGAFAPAPRARKHRAKLEAPPRPEREPAPKVALTRGDRDLSALSVSVFRKKGDLDFDSHEILQRVSRHIQTYVPGARGEHLHGWYASIWSATITFPDTQSSAWLWRKLSPMPTTIDFDGGRVTLGAITNDGVYLPLCRAFETLLEVKIFALKSLADDIKSYRSRTDDA